MRFWYRKDVASHIWALLLFPFTFIFGIVSIFRHTLFRLGMLKSYRAPVPVVVVGNLSVGGNGKTPVVVWLVEQLQQRGVKVGVISRGYGSKASHYPLLVSAQTDPIEGGDEPVLIAKRTGVFVSISPNRRQAIELLLQHQDCDVIISDDGLQHYQLQRDFEIVVVDGERVFGNGFLMPSGPLRELPSRLKQVDLVIANGKQIPQVETLMRLYPEYATNIKTKEKRLLTQFCQQPVIALAGIGYPPRFFMMLQEHGIHLAACHSFADHQPYSLALLQPLLEGDNPVFMTEKDAVKCEGFAQDNWWYVPVDAKISGQRAVLFLEKVMQTLKQ